MVGNVSTYVNIFNWHPLRFAAMKTGKQLPSIYLWPHLEILETVTYETEDFCTSPEIQGLVCSNLRSVPLVIYMIMKKKEQEGKKITFFSETILNILFLLKKKENPNNINV